MAGAKTIATPKQEQALMTEIWDPLIADNPLNFVRFIFPWGKEGTPLAEFKGPRAWQCEALEEVADHIRVQKANKAAGKPIVALQMATAAGRGIGKSALEVMLGYWMISTRIGSTVVVSANTDDQLRKVTWGELGLWHGVALNSHWFDLQATSLAPAAWFVDAIKRYGPFKNRTGPLYQMTQKLWSEENPNSYAGPHNGNGFMILFDEASGIPETIWTIASLYLTEPIVDRYWFAFSNPRKPDGAFFGCFNEARDFWSTRNIDARTVDGTDKHRYEQTLARYGADSDEARVEVYGQFPNQGDNQFIDRNTVAAAAERELLPDEWAPLIMGVDVARFGADKSVIRFRRGRDARSVPPLKFKGLDNMQLAYEVAAAIDKYKPDAVCIDAGNGTGVIDRLRDLRYRVHEVWFGSKADSEEWANKRTEIWARMREWLAGGCIDNDKELRVDLAGPQYKYQGSSDKIMLEAKEEMKKRKVASPDDGDALACTFAVRVSRLDTKTSARGGGGRPRRASGVDYDPLG